MQIERKREGFFIDECIQSDSNGYEAQNDDEAMSYAVAQSRSDIFDQLKEPGNIVDEVLEDAIRRAGGIPDTRIGSPNPPEMDLIL